MENELLRALIYIYENSASFVLCISHRECHLLEHRYVYLPVSRVEKSLDLVWKRKRIRRFIKSTNPPTRAHYWKINEILFSNVAQLV